MIEAKDFPTRKAFLAAASKPRPGERAKPDTSPAPKPQTPPYIMPPCVHRGPNVETTECAGCGPGRALKVFGCEVHVACTIEKQSVDPRIKVCRKCPDRATMPIDIPFASFQSKYADKTGLIVGRGPTIYHWSELDEHDGPIFAINDAALEVEKHTDSPHTFMHAQDKRIATNDVNPNGCLPVRSKLVIAKGGNVGREVANKMIPGMGPIVWAVQPARGDERLLTLSRDVLAIERRLYHARKREDSPSPTICQAIHFAWFCGCEHVEFIGCDGRPTGYNPHMENRSASPEVALSKYTAARADAEHVLNMLRMTWRYLGTP